LSKPWNGRDRYEEFCDSVQERKGYPEFMKKILLRRWLLSAVAAVLKTHGFHCRGVLVLQGRQGIGKSRFFQALVSDASLCASVVLLGHHLDGANKDSMTTAIAHWIVELGELDGTLKKDIARLKGFITSNSDKLRRPYGRLDSEYPRRTVFGASVNDNNFLVDDTGNSRWWTIACESINYAHGIDMQQLFAQFAVYFSNGEQWWLTPEEEQMLDEVNKSHRIVSMIRERVLGAIDLQPELGTQLPAMTAIELLEEVGVQRPTNPQCKECASILREIYGDPKKVNGRYVWRVALSHNTTDDPLHTGQSANSSSDEDDADLY
jgi:putative DNA primase/helicase